MNDERQATPGVVHRAVERQRYMGTWLQSLQDDNYPNLFQDLRMGGYDGLTKCMLDELLRLS
jgi:hypothetical protein